MRVASSIAFLVASTLLNVLCDGPERTRNPLIDECAFEVSERQPCGRRHDALGKWECVARGCCFDDSENVEAGTHRCFLAHRKSTSACWHIVSRQVLPGTS